MLYTRNTAAQRRVSLREGLGSGHMLLFPGAFSPLSALLIEEQGFDGVYVSGAAVAADLGLPDIGLTTATEVAARAGQIARVTGLPTLADADTGFGGPINVARTIQAFEDAGIAGCHLEDQIEAKRCGHLAGKTLVAPHEMVARVAAAVRARRDPNFVICARTDARASEGLDAAIVRAKTYVDAGADMIFAEALAEEREYEAFRAALKVPLLANMTEFGLTPLLSTRTLESLGVNLAIYPVTLLRLAMGAAEQGLAEIRASGSQSALVERMQTRERLYQLLDYPAYAQFDDRHAGYREPDRR